MSGTTFREWLAARLRGTRYATVQLRDDEIDAVAKRLGVDPDLLLEVRAQELVALHERGFAQPISNAKRRPADALRDYLPRLYQLQLWMPPAIVEAWYAECERRGVHASTFLRSLIHAYLLGAREPDPVKYWRWQGKLHRAPKSEETNAHTTIPQGARRAIGRRAAARGTKQTAIVRALVLEAMHGQHSGIPLVSSSMMYDDETRYNTVPLDPPRPSR